MSFHSSMALEGNKSMRVIDYINQANPSEVARIYSEVYGATDGWGTIKSFNEFRNIINDIIGIKMGDDQFKVVIQWIVQDWGELSKGKFTDIDEYFSVSGRKVSAPAQSWSLSMTDWGEWKEMEVENESGKELSLDEITTHLYYEITWFGLPEKQQEARDSLIDQTEKLERDFANHKEGDPLPDGYVEWKPRESD